MNIIKNKILTNSKWLTFYVNSQQQIREGTEDNSKIIFLISQQKHML